MIGIVFFLGEGVIDIKDIDRNIFMINFMVFFFNIINYIFQFNLYGFQLICIFLIFGVKVQQGVINLKGICL